MSKSVQSQRCAWRAGMRLTASAFDYWRDTAWTMAKHAERCLRRYGQRREGGR